MKRVTAAGPTSKPEKLSAQIGSKALDSKKHAKAGSSGQGALGNWKAAVAVVSNRRKNFGATTHAEPDFVLNHKRIRIQIPAVGTILDRGGDRHRDLWRTIRDRNNN